MEWTASDIALVISTSATAIAAISGLAVPIWQGISENRHARREQVYANASDAIYFCVQHVDQVATHRSNEAMRFAFLKAGFPIPDEDERRSEKLIASEFEKNLRTAELLGREVGASLGDFLSYATLAITTVDEFEFEGGNLVVISDQQDIASRRRSAVGNFVIAASGFLHEVREKVNLRP